jgi:hypothetical protein
MQTVEFSDHERDIYNAVETRSQVTLNRYLAKGTYELRHILSAPWLLVIHQALRPLWMSFADKVIPGTVNNNYANVLVMLLRLRQICCHPHLVKDLGVQASTEGIAEDTLLERANLLAEDVVNRLTETDSFECPICYETDANPTIIIPCGHTTCGDCFQKLIDPSRAVREGNESASARCPHCRGAVSSERITDFKHFCKVFCPGKLTGILKAAGYGDAEDETPEVESGVASDSDSDSDSEFDSDDERDDKSLDDFVVPDDEVDAEEPEGPQWADDIATPPIVDQNTHRDKGKAKANGKGKGKGTLFFATVMFQIGSFTDLSDI